MLYLLGANLTDIGIDLSRNIQEFKGCIQVFGRRNGARGYLFKAPVQGVSSSVLVGFGVSNQIDCLDAFRFAAGIATAVPVGIQVFLVGCSHDGNQSMCYKLLLLYCVLCVTSLRRSYDRTVTSNEGMEISNNQVLDE